MRNSKTCPKCGARDVVRIPGTVGMYGAGNNIAAGFGQVWLGGFLKLPAFVKVTRYLCATCGFSEEWIDDPEDLAKLKATFGPQK